MAMPIKVIFFVLTIFCINANAKWLPTRVWEVIPSKSCGFQSNKAFIRFYEGEDDPYNTNNHSYLVIRSMVPNNEFGSELDWGTIGYSPSKETPYFYMKDGWFTAEDGQYSRFDLNKWLGPNLWRFEVYAGGLKKGKNREVTIRLTSNILTITDAKVDVNGKTTETSRCEFVNKGFLETAVINFFDSLPFESDVDIQFYLKNAIYANERFGTDIGEEKFYKLIKQRFESGSTSAVVMYHYVYGILDIEDGTSGGGPGVEKYIPFVEGLNAEQKMVLAREYLKNPEDAYRLLPGVLLKKHRDDLFFQLFPLGSGMDSSYLALELIKSERMDLLKLVLRDHRDNKTYFGKEEVIVRNVTFLYDINYLEVLLDHGVGLDQKYFCQAMERRDELDRKRKMIDLFIGHGVKMDGPSCGAIAAVVSGGSVELVEDLIARGANLNFTVDNYGPTAIFYSFWMTVVKYGNDFSLSEKLIALGADLSMKYDNYYVKVGKPVTLCELIGYIEDNYNRSNPKLPRYIDRKSKEIFCR